MVNPEILNVTHRDLPAGDNRYIDGILASGETVVKNQAVAIETSGREYAALQSAAVDGTQFIRGFAAEGVDASGGALPIRVLVSGDIDDSQIVFDGADTLATVPATPAGQPDDYLTMLRDYGIFAKTIKDLFIQDNQ